MAFRQLPRLALGLVLCVTVGCSEDAAQQSSATTGTASFTLDSTTSTVPGSGQITVFGLSPDEEVALDVTRERLIAECMSRAGFEYVPVEAAQFRAEINERASSTIPLPLSDKMLAPVAGKTSEDPNREYVDALSDDAEMKYYSALTGDPNQPPELLTLPDGSSITLLKGGCWNQTRGKMFGDINSAVIGEMVIGNADVAVAERVLQQPTVIAAMALWRQCMAIKGYQFQTYLDAAEARSAMAEVDSARIETADRTCSDENDLYNVVVAATENAKLEVVATEGEALAEYLQQRRDVARRALESADGG